MGVRDLTCGKAGDWTSPAAYAGFGLFELLVIAPAARCQPHAILGGVC